MEQPDELDIRINVTSALVAQWYRLNKRERAGVFEVLATQMRGDAERGDQYAIAALYALQPESHEA